MYRLLNNLNNVPTVVLRSDGWSIPFDPANTDYAAFKKEILEGTAQLQDADGVEMTADAAKDFVRGLP